VNLTILSICDRTGIWSEPFARAGYRVIRWDLADGHDVRLCDYLGKLHGIIAQPPCTHLAGSGARWWESKGEAALLEAMAVVDACLRFVVTGQPEWWVLENPVGRLTTKLGPPAFIFDPCEYAGWADDPSKEAYTKRTCLWGRFNEPAKAAVVPVLGSIMHLLPPSDDRQHLRSVTPTGFARAFFAANGQAQSLFAEVA
jgi:hypothetical protein